MRKTVHSKLICSYIFIGIVGFLFATAGGSHFVETYLEEEVGARLYDSAVRLLLMLSLYSRLQTMIAKDWKDYGYSGFRRGSRDTNPG